MAVLDSAYFENLCFCVGALGIVLFSVIIRAIWIYFLAFVALLVCLRNVHRKTAGKIEVRGQGIFITGCDTGFGHDLALRLDHLGFTLFAGCLYPDGEGAKKLRSRSSRTFHIVPLDVGEDESVCAARDYVVKHLPETGLWAIVNNAGIGMLGDVEWLTVNLYHKAMNINFYGAARTIRTFLYLVRKTKGRVVVVTSVHGRMSFPGGSGYEASKFALETMTDSLRLEMSKFGVKVAKIQPGNFGMATGCRSPAIMERIRQEANHMWDEASDDARQTYTRNYLDVKTAKNERITFATSGSASTTKRVIDAMVDAITNERPDTSYLVDGGEGWIDPPTTFARYYRYLPTFISDRILYWWTKCDRFPEPSDLQKN